MRKRRIDAQFEFEAGRLALAEGRSDATFIRCPICLRLFSRDALSKGLLTMEHIVPRRVGGRMQTITCKACNNTQGSRLDSHVVEAAKSRAAFAGHRTIRTTVAIGGAAFEAEVAWKLNSSSTNVITVIRAASDPRQVAAARRHLESGVRQIDLSFSLGYIPNRLWLGLLRAAYLGVFHNHGYVYALAPSVAAIRRQITGEDSPSPHLSRIVKTIPTPPVRMPSGFVEVDLEPRTGYPVQMVFLQTRLVQTTTHVVFLPRADSETADTFERLAQVADALNGHTLTVRLPGQKR